MSTYNIPFFNMKTKNALNYPKSAAFQGTQERVRKSRGKRAISVLPLKFYCIFFDIGEYFEQSMFEISLADCSLQMSE